VRSGFGVRKASQTASVTGLIYGDAVHGPLMTARDGRSGLSVNGVGFQFVYRQLYSTSYLFVTFVVFAMTLLKCYLSFFGNDSGVVLVA